MASKVGQLGVEQRRLGERFLLQEMLGQGGMAVVYRATDLRNERTLALKVLRDALSDDPTTVARFEQEACSAAALCHPNIVTIYEAGRLEGSRYIAMQLVEGGDLRQYLDRRGPLPIAEVVSIASQIASALAAAHRQGLIHRDVKPANILITAEGTAKLTDFGIARALSGARMTTAGAVMGSARYISPEQVLGQPAESGSDLYALAVVVYEMLTGRPPFEAETPLGLLAQHAHSAPVPPSRYRRGIPPRLEHAVLRALKKKPEARHPSAEAFALALQKALEAPQATPASWSASDHAPSAFGARRPEQARRNAGVQLLRRPAWPRPLPRLGIAAAILLAFVLLLVSAGRSAGQTTGGDAAPAAPERNASALTSPAGSRPAEAPPSGDGKVRVREVVGISLPERH